MSARSLLLKVLAVCRNTTLNAVVEAPNVDIAYKAVWQPAAHADDASASFTEQTAPVKEDPGESSSRSHEQEKLDPADASRLARGKPAAASEEEASGASARQTGQQSIEQEQRPGHRRPSAHAEDCPLGPPFKGKATLKHQFAGHDLMATVALNEEFLDSAAAYCRVPVFSSLDVASQDRQDGIQYRAGIHQVCPSVPCMWLYGFSKSVPGVCLALISLKQHGEKTGNV